MAGSFQKTGEDPGQDPEIDIEIEIEIERGIEKEIEKEIEITKGDTADQEVIIVEEGREVAVEDVLIITLYLIILILAIELTLKTQDFSMLGFLSVNYRSTKYQKLN